MSDSQTPDPSADPTSAAAANPGLAALLLGGGGGYGFGGGGASALANVQLAPIQPQLAFGQGLLRQAADISPVRSPWQAAARAIGGLLGGYEVGQAGQRMSDLYGGWQQQARDLLGGLQTPQAPTAQAAPPTSLQAPAAQPAAAPAELDAPITAAAAKYNLPKPVLVGLLKHESNFDPTAVNKDSGAIGLGQILPSTATKPGFGIDPVSTVALKDAATNIDFSAKYLDARGRGLYGAAWNPNDPAMIKAALNGYGDGTPGYADAVLAKGGVPVPSAAAPDPATNPQANQAAGVQAANELRMRIAAGLASGNPIIQAMAPQLNQIAATMVNQGRFQNFTDPNTGNILKRDLLTNAVSPAGPPMRAEQQVLTQLNALGTKYQQDPTSLTPLERTQLLTGIAEHFKPSYDKATQVLNWEVGTPQWAKDAYAASGAGTPGAAAAVAPRSPAEVQAGITRATEDYKEDADRATKFLDAAQAGDATLASTQNIRNLVASGKVKPGYFAPLMSEISKVMTGAGYDPTVAQKITGIDPATAEELNKFLFQLQTAKLREQGAREPGSVLQMFMSNYPNWQSRPETIEGLTRALDLQVMYDKARAQGMMDWTQTHRGDISGYQRIGTTAFNNWFKDQYGSPSEWAMAGMAASPSQYATDAQGNRTYKPVPMSEWGASLPGGKAAREASAHRVAQIVGQAYPGRVIGWEDENGKPQLIGVGGQ